MGGTYRFALSWNTSEIRSRTAITYDVMTVPSLNVVESTSATVSPTVVARILRTQNTSVTSGTLLTNFPKLLSCVVSNVRRSLAGDTHRIARCIPGATPHLAF